MRKFTRSIQDRVFAGFLGVVFGIGSGFLLHPLLYACLTQLDSSAARVRITKIQELIFYGPELLFCGFVLVVFVSSILGIVWAFFTPDWIGRFIVSAFKGYWFLLFLWILLFAGIIFWESHK